MSRTALMYSLCSPLLCCLLASAPAAAQGWPSKPIRIVVGSAGGAGDLSSRLVAERIAGPLGQQVIVDNRATVIVGEVVAKSPADGYTLLMDANSLWTNPLLQPMPYDVARDFAPVSTTDSSISILAVHPSVPATTVKDLIALAKSRPGQLNFGTGAPGTLSNLSAELFKSMAGVDIVRVPYKGAAQTIAAALAGEVQIVMYAAPIMPHIRSGKLKPLGVASLQPSPVTPDLPTVASTGLPGFEAVLIQGILAPARTPEPVIRRLNQEIVRALAAEDIRAKYLAMGVQAVSSTPEEFAARIKEETARWTKLIKEAGIKAQ